MLNLSIFCRPTSLYKVSSYNSYQVFFFNRPIERGGGGDALNNEKSDDKCSSLPRGCGG